MDELRRALRALAAAKGFTAISVLTLGVGMALFITVLTVANAYVFRGLPYPAADRLYRVDYAAPGENAPRGLEKLDWQSLGDVIEFAVSWDLDVFYLLGRESTERAPGAWITPGYMQALGLRAAMGRLFDAADFASASPAVALISHRLWQTRFGSDPAILGKRFQAYVSDRPDEPEALTIVGVMPPDLWHFNAYTEVLAPLRAPSYPYMVRLREGVPASAAAERIGALVGGLGGVPGGWSARLTSQQASYTETVRPMLWAVGVSAGLILLIAAANVAVLMLIRGRQREKELAVRLALGASHARLAVLVALEGLLIGSTATIFGLAATRLSLGAIAPLVERFLERPVPGGLDAFAVDGTVILAAIGCGLAVTLLATLTPLVALWQTSLLHGLTMLSRGATEGRQSRRLRSLLIGFEVAASLTLLAGAALMARSAIQMLHVDFGIRADRVATASLSLRQRSYPDPASRAAYYDRLLTVLAGVGGGRGAALGDSWPLQGARPRRLETGGTARITGSASVFAISPGYFSVLGMTIGHGRDFDARDRIGGEPVALVSDTLARRMWPAGSAVGQRLVIHPDGVGAPEDHLVIGVVNDVRQSHADTDTADAYLALAQRAGRFAFVYLQGAQSASWESELRSAVSAIDHEVALGAPRLLDAGLEQERARPRFLTYLLMVFAALACVLALVGVHGVIAYAVGQRRREIAIRMAVGATGRSVTTLFVRQGTMVLVGGLLAGTAGALALGRVLRSQLFGVEASDPGILAGAAVAFALSGLVAVWWPATRAAATDPASVLKES